uniref:Ig-like domain-containing protein n=1 Tax=Cairina moschata TaxID=8855 RepID=A0A8C3C107_CAIMO
DAALTQPASKLVNLGGNMQITCSGSSGSYGWFQQKTPGSAPVTVIYSNDKRPSGMPSRFSGSTSGTTNTLTITGVQAEVEAVYFCGAWDGSAGHGEPSTLSRSSCVFPSRPFTIFIALLWALSSSLMSFLYCGAQNCTQYSR